MLLPAPPWASKKKEKTTLDLLGARRSPCRLKNVGDQEVTGLGGRGAESVANRVERSRRRTWRPGPVRAPRSQHAEGSAEGT